MKQTKNTKTSKTSHLSISRKASLILAALSFVALVVYGVLIIRLVHQNNNRYDGRIGDLIMRAVEQLNQPLPTDAKTGQAYIHEANMTFPAIPMELGRVVYVYTPGFDGASAEIHLASLSDIRRAEGPIMNAPNSTAVFKAAPHLQACSRGVTVTFGAQTGLHAAGSKTLSNGQTAYFYDEPDCSNQDLLNYAKQINNY